MALGHSLALVKSAGSNMRTSGLITALIGRTLIEGFDTGTVA